MSDKDRVRSPNTAVRVGDVQLSAKWTLESVTWPYPDARFTIRGNTTIQKFNRLVNGCKSDKPLCVTLGPYAGLAWCDLTARPLVNDRMSLVIEGCAAGPWRRIGTHNVPEKPIES